MSNITEFYNLISEKREELQTLRFTPVNKREKDFIKKMKNAKKEIREARIKISKILSYKEVK